VINDFLVVQFKLLSRLWCINRYKNDVNWNKYW